MGDIADDFDVDEYNSPEFYWEDGEHKTKEGEIIKIKDMTTSHLKNTIKYFSEAFNTSILEKELKKRNKKKK